MVTNNMLVMTLALALTLNGLSQTGGAIVEPITDFSGTWRIDRGASTESALGDSEDLTYVISYNSPELRAKRIIKEKSGKERISDVTYYTDGRGESIPLLFGNEKVKAKTTWDGNVLVSKFTISSYVTASKDFRHSDCNEFWSLARGAEPLW